MSSAVEAKETQLGNLGNSLGCLGRCTLVERRVNAEVEAVEVRFGEWRGSRRFVNQGQWQPEEFVEEGYDYWGWTPPQKKSQGARAAAFRVVWKCSQRRR